jgi:hypothetical protein
MSLLGPTAEVQGPCRGRDACFTARPPAQNRTCGWTGDLKAKVRYTWESNSVANWQDDLLMPFTVWDGFPRLLNKGRLSSRSNSLPFKPMPAPPLACLISDIETGIDVKAHSAMR